MISCNGESSLDKYFVENAANKNFVSLDVSPAMFNTKKAKFSAEQTEALKSFEKMNLLYFKKTATNTKEFDAQRLKIKNVLKDTKYQDLIRFGTGKDGVDISYVGIDDHISEFIVSAGKNDIGLGVVRIQGKDMKPESIMKILEVLQSGNLNIEALKPILEMIKR